MAKILWIEDEADKISGLVYPLKKSGHIIDVGKNKSEALDIINKTAYDLIILDIIIPDGTENFKLEDFYPYEGVNLLRDIKKIIPNTPIIVLSIVTDNQVLHEIDEIGVSIILRKGSYLPSDLKKEVYKLLDISDL